MTDLAELRAITIPEVLELLELPEPPRIPGHIECPGENHADNTPSLFVQDHHWHCFGCGVGGDAVDLVRFVTNASFGQAARYLSGLAELDRPEYTPRAKPPLLDLGDVWQREPGGFTEEAQEYLAGRFPHLALAVLQKWPIRFTRHALWVAHTDHHDVIRGIKTRSYYNGSKKSVAGSNFTTRLYRVEEKPRRVDAVLTEGESDCWTLSQHWLEDDTTTVFSLPSGAGLVRDGWLDELLEYEHVGFFPDNDDAGQRAFDKVKHLLPSVRECRVPPDYNDVTEAYTDGWRP